LIVADPGKILKIGLGGQLVTDDAELILQLKQGNQGAFRKLVDSFQSRVMQISYRFVLNREDAEDIAQEVFIEVFRSVVFFRGEAKLSSWIYRITVSKSLDFIRKRKREKRMGYLLDIFGNKPEVENRVASGSPEPQQILEQKERIRILGQALDSLPENQRIAYTLNKMEGISNREIAEIMGATLTATDTFIYRARINLEKKLYRYYHKNL
jgi:RNA polymerase sigma-70 factor, ECF subfamily